MSSKLGLNSDYGFFLDSITSTTTFTKAQKRWRIAFAAIHFTLSLSRDIELEKRNQLSIIAQKRWRLAYTMIYSSRAMLSLLKEIVPSSQNPAGFFPSPHLVLEIKQGDGHHDVEETTLKRHLLEKGNEDDSCFPAIDKSKLAEMVKEKDLDELRRFGGANGLTKALQSDPKDGILGDDPDISQRKSSFGTNTYNKPPPKGLVHFVLEAFKDTTIFILLCCAALSLGFGIKEHGGKEGWYEGGSIFVAVLLVVVVSALSNFRQERQFDKLSKISDNIKIDVIRVGRRQKISIFDIVVGDVVFLTIGDQIPADGVFLGGHSFQVDESSMTGESDHVEVDIQNPFLLSGSKVADGYAQMLVTSVGMNTAWGKMMSSIARDSDEQTPLQARLNKLTSSIGK
ncbi:Calcium-transporting ATPase, partial [Actinidia chinensis var. chinensis]